VLGILYESYIHPITISVRRFPRPGFGRSACLVSSLKTELTIIAMIGIILLIGIVKKECDSDDRFRAGRRAQ